MLQIATGDPRPIFRQIVDGIAMKIATGVLEPGARLPSVRALAMQLTVNANTVAKAYAELTAQGMIESRKGVGVFVSTPRQTLSDIERNRRLESALERFLADIISLGFSPEEIHERVEDALGRLRENHPSRRKD